MLYLWGYGVIVELFFVAETTKTVNIASKM